MKMDVNMVKVPSGDESDTKMVVEKIGFKKYKKQRMSVLFFMWQNVKMCAVLLTCEVQNFSSTGARVLQKREKRAEEQFNHLQNWAQLCCSFRANAPMI